MAHLFRLLSLAGLALGLATAPRAQDAAPAPDWFNKDRDSRISDEGDLEESTAAKIALYPVRRLADFADIITAQVGFGVGLHANLHATRAAQFGLGGATVSKLGLDGRQIGIVTDKKAETALFPFQIETYSRSNSLGNFRNYQSAVDQPWLYQLHRDYFEVGGESHGRHY